LQNLHPKREYLGDRWKRRRDNRTRRLLHNQSHLGRRREMIHLESQYFNLNKILLLVIGLWPYQQSKFTRFQFVFFSTILTTGIIFQVKVEYNNNRI